MVDKWEYITSQQTLTIIEDTTLRMQFEYTRMVSSASEGSPPNIIPNALVSSIIKNYIA